MPGFKAKPPARNTNDLITTLTDSPVKTKDNPLYQTIFNLINIVANYIKANNEIIGVMEQQINAIDTSKDDPIPGFFFMGSS